ncbi:MAG: SDR family NAD(P)-dependent oxidoreductase [Mycobacteriales bacterium]
MSRVVLVVGASSGIGRAAAQQLAERGDVLVLAARAPGPLEQAAAECRAAGAASVLAVPTDVGDAAAVDALVAAVVAEHGRLDAVVHSAGVVAYGRFEQVPGEVFDAVMRTNVSGAANVVRAALPLLRDRGQGTVVLVGSVLGDVAVPAMTPYVVSKYALRGLARQLAIENRDRPGVRVCIVSPGGVDTPIYQQAANYLGHPGRPPAPVDSAARVASKVVGALDRPRDRISVGRANPLMRLGFSLTPWLYDAMVGPLFRVLALRREEVGLTDGNVFAPQGDLEAVDGGHGQGLEELVHPLDAPRV